MRCFFFYGRVVLFIGVMNDNPSETPLQGVGVKDG
jgi:hypothetical protein